MGAGGRRSAPSDDRRLEGVGGEVELVGELAGVDLPLVLQRRSLAFPVEPLEDPLLSERLGRDVPSFGDVLQLLAGDEAHPQLEDLRFTEALTGPGAFVVGIRRQCRQIRGEFRVLDNAIIRRLSGTTMASGGRGFEVRPAAQAAKGGKRHERHDNG